MGNLTVKKIMVFSMLMTLISMDGWCEEGKFIYDDKGNRDPFIPLIGEVGKGIIGKKVPYIEGIYVEGVIWDPAGESFVIINDEIVSVGGIVGDFEVVDIGEAFVIFAKGEEFYEINLKEEGEE